MLLLLTGALVVGGIVFGVAVLLTGNEGLGDVEPDGRSVALPVSRPLVEADLEGVRFDATIRGYRMAQVDQALRRAAYDIGYKSELIHVLEAEVTALREGRQLDADSLRAARMAAVAGGAEPAGAEMAVDDAEVSGLGDIAAAATTSEAPEAPIASPGAVETVGVAGETADGTGSVPGVDPAADRELAGPR